MNISFILYPKSHRIQGYTIGTIEILFYYVFCTVDVHNRSELSSLLAKEY